MTASRSPSIEPAPRRSDARRNREHIIEVARAAFAEAGAAASMNEIARRAGIGMATLYRNFPNRRALLEALYVGNVEQLVSTVAELQQLPPADALTTFLRRFARHFSDKQSLAAELLLEGDASSPVFTDSRRMVFQAVDGLLDRAQQAGQIRTDITLDQLMDLVGGVLAIPSTDAEYVEHILDVALDGLRVR